LIFYKIKPKKAEIIAVLATLIGMLLFFGDKLAPGMALGNIFAILSGLCFAGIFITNKRDDIETDQALMLGFIINAAIGVPFAFVQATADPYAWGTVAILGIVQVGLAYIFFARGIKRTAALPACLITALEPVLNPLWVAFATGEVPGAFSFAGGAVIIISVVCYNVREAKR
jgi:drug/metabolite transporter (DMT)-like permease